MSWPNYQTYLDARDHFFKGSLCITVILTYEYCLPSLLKKIKVKPTAYFTCRSLPDYAVLGDKFYEVLNSASCILN